jgi:hypothetical protein
MQLEGDIMQEFWVRIGEQNRFPTGAVKVLKVDEKKGVKIRLIPESSLEEVRRIRGPLVEPIRPRMAFPVTLGAFSD